MRMETVRLVHCRGQLAEDSPLSEERQKFDFTVFYIYTDKNT